MPFPRIVARYRAVLTDVIQIAAGNSHGCFLTAQGKVYTFGRNSSKVISTESDQFFYIPQDVTKEFVKPNLGNKVVHVACANTCVYMVTDSKL